MRLRSVVAISLLAVAPAPARAGLPRAVLDRPITLPGGTVELGVDVGGTRDPDDDLSRSQIALGVTDALELGASYDAPLAHPQAPGTGALAIAYRVLGGPLEVALRARYTPDAASPWTVGAQLELCIAGRVKLVSSGDQLGAGLSAPIALGVQVTPTIYVQLGARIPIGVLDGAPPPPGAPVALDVVVGALASADVLAEIAIDGAAPDRDAAARSLGWSVGVRYRPR